MLGHDLRFERTGAVTGQLDLDRSDGIGKHGLGAGAVAGIATIAPGRITLVLAQVIGDLTIALVRRRNGVCCPNPSPMGRNLRDPLESW
jgi:hypothetical protein